jgi:F-type H+-transporting ATPase subunit b
MLPIFQLLANTATPAEAASGDGVVTQISKTFHIEWGLFIPQVICFLVVAFLLKKFAFVPVQKMLEQRRARIAEGEDKLHRIEQQLADSDKRTAEAIAKANEEAKRMIHEARDAATAISEQKAQEAIVQAQQILAKAEAAARTERDQMAAELRREFGRLVATTTAQVTGKVLTEEDRRRINEEALAKVEA